MIGLITGQVGSGKTTVCLKAWEMIRARGLAAGGILSPARHNASGAKIGIDVLDVATGRKKALADYEIGGGRTIGPYTFDPDILAWANARLRAAIQAAPDLLFVDEIGPLELAHGKGFAPILPLLADRRRVRHAVIVVRQACVADLEGRLARPDVRRFWVNPHRRDHLPVEIAETWSPRGYP